MRRKQDLSDLPLQIQLVHVSDLRRKFVWGLHACNHGTCLSQSQNTIDGIGGQSILGRDQEERVRIDTHFLSNEANLICHFHALQVNDCAEFPLHGLP